MNNNNLAPRAAASSLWLVVFLKPDGSQTFVDRIFTDIDEALEDAGYECEPEDQIKLVQVCLDYDTPARWAEDATRRVKALVSPGDHIEAIALAEQVIEILDDYQPKSVSELPEAGEHIRKQEGK
jgi:hypothetical protein